MNPIESLLRDATRDTAAQITPDSLLPLDPARLGAARPVRSNPLRRVIPVLGPVAAIAAVALIVITTLAQRSGQRPAATSDNGVPPYYVALTGGAQPANGPFRTYKPYITVRATLTGTILATVRPPHPYASFESVQGTGDNTTFLVGASANIYAPGSLPSRLYMLRYRPDTRKVTLTPLSVQPRLWSSSGQESLSPDGRYLAVASYNTLVKYTLAIYDLRTGAVRRWTTAATGNIASGFVIWAFDNSLEMSWTANDQALSFVWKGVNSDSLRLLDTNSHGDLLTASKVVMPSLDFHGRGFACGNDPFIAADGSVALCAGWTTTSGVVMPPMGMVTTGIGEFSVTTGKLIAILDPKRVHLPRITTRVPVGRGWRRETIVDVSKLPALYYASPDASVLIGTWGDSKAFVLHNGREQTIPSQPRSYVFGVAW